MFQAPTAPAPTPAAPVIPPSAPPPAPLTPPTRRASRKPLVVFIILLVLVALGVGGYFAYAAWQQATNPQAIVETALAAVAKITSASVTADVEVTFSRGTLPSGRADVPSILKLAMEGSYAMDPENPQVDGTLTLTLPVGSLGPLGAMTLNPKISVRKKTADTVYIRVDQVPPLPFLDLSKVSGQWVKIDLAELKQKYGVNIDAAKNEVNAAQGERVAKIYREHPFLALTRLPAETVDGVQTDHLRFRLESGRLKEFIVAVTQEFGGRVPTDDELKQFDEFVANSLAVEGELWIGREDHFVRQVTATGQMKIKDQGEGAVNLRETFNNINQPVTIEEPADSISLDEAMQRVQAANQANFQGMEVSSGPQGRLYEGEEGTVVDGGADADGDGLTNFREQVLGSDPRQTDSDGDGFPDGDEVTKGYNPAGAGLLTPQQQADLSKFR